MTQQARPKPVVVGIDGSQDALNAATWAVGEAVLRDAPLRLVHVSSRKPAAGDPEDREDDKSALCLAKMTIQDMGKPVEVETAMRCGRAECVLIDESRDAVLVCVGPGGRGRFADKSLGSTAAALAKHAHCPVAIVRADGTSQTEQGWIAVVQNDEADNEAVVHRAMEEGRLRSAPVLLIDRRLNSWVRRYPDVRVQTVAARPGAKRFIENPGDPIQLVVAGSADADHLARLDWPDYDPVLAYDNCSVLLLRN